MGRILLADDDAAMRDFVRRALEGDGHVVVAASDGAEALDHFEHAGGRFDLLISDVQMPGLDGIALAEKVVSSNPKLRVILMSGYAAGEANAARLAPNLKRIVAKPFTLEQIRQIVRETLAA